ncbi:MAG: hypothetical protein ACM3JH_16205 [Acidithiobacillales bacterium]
MSLRAVSRALLLASVVGGLVLWAQGEQSAPDGWRPFTATWTLSGQRSLLPTEGERPASIVSLSGPLTITSGQGLGRGLLGQVIGFDDGGALLAGRAVFTDEHGDRIFCTLQAEPIGTGRRATATITGGTGRFAGLEGSFSFAWQYVVGAEGDEFSGRAVNIEGRTRHGPQTRSKGEQ